MSEHDHHPGLSLDSEPGPEHDDEHEEGHDGEREHGPAPKKKAPRFPFARRKVAGAAKWKRETRFGVAALLSFVILITVLLINKPRAKDKIGGKDAPRERLVVMQVPPSKESSADSSKSAPKPEKDSEKGSDSPPPPSQSNLVSPLAEPTPLALSDNKLREAANESVRQPAAEQGGNPPLPPPAETTPPDKTFPGGSKGAEPEVPLPVPTALPPATKEPTKDEVAAPEPAPVAEAAPPPSHEPVMPPPSLSPGSTTDLAGPVELPGAAGSDEVATTPAQPPETKTDHATPGAEPGSNVGNAPVPPAEPAPAPAATDPAAPAVTEPATPAATEPPAPAATEPQAPMPIPPPARPETSPSSPPQGENQTPPPPQDQAKTSSQTPPPPQAESQTLPQTPSLPHGDVQAQAQTSPPAVSPSLSPSPAVKPGEIPNFDRAPSIEDSTPSPSAPPEIKPGEGIAIPNAGKGRSLDEEVPEKLASVAAAAAGISAVAKAVEKEPLAPELHVVERGENFWTISRHYYSSGRYYMALWKANSRTVPAADQLMVGQTIIIPPPEALDRSLIEPPRVGTGSSSSSSSSRAGAPVRRTSRSKPNAGDSAGTPVRRSSEVELILPIDNSVLDRRSRSRASEELDPAPEKRYRAARPRYKVRTHETLRSIARDTLNNARRADDIYELNRDILGNDPYTPLVEGQILELPEDARLGRESR